MIDMIIAILGAIPLLFFSIPQPEHAEHYESSPIAVSYRTWEPGLMMLS